MSVSRQYHTATLLPNGKVLVCGGLSGGSSADLYDPDTNTWAPTGAMGAGRDGHTATLLADGTVLVCGGEERQRQSSPRRRSTTRRPACGRRQAA